MSNETHDDTSSSDDTHSSDDAADGRRRTAADSPFSLEALQQLVEMMEQHSLSEISLQTGETKWKLRRGPETLPGLPVGVGYPTTPQPPAAAAPEVAASIPTAPVAGGVYIKSPTVGTFYSASTPEDPPFVSVGSRVQPETVVCLVEAMKVFNQIPAEVSGVIAEILVTNGDSVEFGQPLFRITPG